MALTSHNGISVVQSTAEELQLNTSKQLTSDVAMTLEVTDKVRLNLAGTSLEIPQRTGTQLEVTGGGGETFAFGDVVLSSTSVGEYIANTAYICTVAGTGNENYTLIKLGAGGIATVADITAAKSVTPSFDNDLLFVVSLDTIYRYEATELSATTSDDLYLITPTADANARWKAVAGKYIYDRLSQDSQIVKSTSITTATTGTFVTGHGGSTPTISAKFWDDSLSLYNEISPASLDIDINAAGTDVSYDTTALTFAANDFLELKAVYFGLATTPSNEYDSGWITVSAINDTLKGVTGVGYHEVNLPSGFVGDPAGISVVRDDGTNRFPVDIASTVVLSDDGSGQFRLAVETTGWTGTDTFRINASKSARPTGNPLDTVLVEKYVGTVGRSDYPDHLEGSFGKTLTSSDIDRDTAYFWNFSETGPNTTTPSEDAFILEQGSGTSKNLTVIGTFDAAADVEGNTKAVSISGGSDYGQSASLMLATTGSFSLAYFIYKSSWANISEDMVKRKTGSTGWDFYKDGSGNINFRTNGTVQFTYNYNNLEPNVYHHFAISRDVDNTVTKFFIDGELVKEVAVADTLTAGGKFEPGRFVGRIDELAYFNHAIDEDQVRRLYYSSTLTSLHGGVGHTLAADSFNRTINDAIWFWNLEADANDDSGNTTVENLTNVGITPFTATNMNGVIGAASLDGSTQYFKNTSATFDGGGSFSAGGWFKFNRLAVSEILVGKDIMGTTRGWYFARGSSGTKLKFDMFYSGASLITISVPSADTVDDLNWHHIVVVYNQAETRTEMYFDGIIVATATNPLLATRNIIPTADIEIGSYEGGALKFQGELSNAFYANVALTPEEIAVLYSLKTPHTLSANVYDQVMPMKVTKESGLVTKAKGEDFERSTTDTNVYTDLSSLDAGDKVKISLK